MSDPTPGGPDSNPDRARGSNDADGPEVDDPVTVEKILAAAGVGETLEQLPAGENQASKLVALAQLHYQLVKGADGRLYATQLRGPAIALGLRGRDGLRTRLARLYFETYKQAPGGSALSDALAVLEGHAEALDPVPVELRVARTDTAAIAVDLGAVDGRCVIVGPAGWHIAPRSPVLFRRSVLTAPLPDPTDGGSLAELAELINVAEPGFRLIVAWLVAALVPDIPHPILCLTGEQGTAKSTAARMLVDLIDPSPAPLRSPPRDMRSWAVCAAASWAVAIDNVSSIPAWLSDTLCKAVTGDGIVERALFTDDDIAVLRFRRVIALTSIDMGGLAGDLAERLLAVELARIPADQRRPDADITAAYDRARPGALGALLDLVAQVLAALPAIEVDELPRMADFARILAALDDLQGWDTLADYTTTAADIAQTVLDADPVALAISELVGRGGAWQGTAAELLKRITPDDTRLPRGWPTTPQALGAALRRLAPSMRARGITVERPPRGQDRTITITTRHDDRGQGQWF